MIFYKATQPNGTDFYTGTIRYEVGAVVRPAPYKGESVICGPGLLHAATVPTETLIGGRWPCRLFEVEGDPVAGLDEEHPHKAGFRELRVVEELPAWQVFGPQGEQVAALIDRASRLTPEEEYALNDACSAAMHAAAEDAAWDAASDAARNAAAEAACDAAYAVRDTPSYAAWSTVRAAAWSNAASAARDVAAEAALALLVRDCIASEHFDVLYGPWHDVMEAS